MKKKKHGYHEEHLNHEAWAIPYGDLVTLLLAFFVVMYAVSSLNEGKYRQLSESIISAFNGTPKVNQPIQVGERPTAAKVPSAMELEPIDASVAQAVALRQPIAVTQPMPVGQPIEQERAMLTKQSADLGRIADEVERALKLLIDADLVVVRRHPSWLEVEIRTDILFASGVATLSAQSLPALRQLATILGEFPNAVRVEGYTDDRPISTAIFPTNWELSAARAASVARLFIDNGVEPQKLAIMGLGEYHPNGDNSTEEGRNRNRRVKIVVLGQIQTAVAESRPERLPAS